MLDIWRGALAPPLIRGRFNVNQAITFAFQSQPAKMGHLKVVCQYDFEWDDLVSLSAV